MKNEKNAVPVENIRPKKLPSEYSDKGIANLIVNYNRKGRIEGGPMTLNECYMEQARRKLEGYDEYQITEKIGRLAEKNGGLVTYGDLWKGLFPNRPWKGNNSQRIMRNILFSVLDLCRLNSWPLITCLVVNGRNNELTEEAKRNIFDYAVRHKLTSDTDVNRYIDKIREECFSYFLNSTTETL